MTALDALGDSLDALMNRTDDPRGSLLLGLASLDAEAGDLSALGETVARIERDGASLGIPAYVATMIRGAIAPA